MPTKRPRLPLDDQTDSPTTPARVSLTNLPIEILAEILLYTRSPLTVLAVSRTCSFLYRSLAQNSDASFIWRGVRRTCKPVPLPDPGNGWKKSEADYAAFVFGGGVCEVCRKNTREMYVSFAARIRLCGSWHCRSRFLDEFLVNVTSELRSEDRQMLWVPPLESTRCFYPSRVGALIWPRGEVMLRKSDWEAFRRDLQAYKDAEQARAELKGDEQTERVLARCRAALRKLPQIMELSERLIRWKWDYDREYKDIKKQNEIWTKSLADLEGWDLGDLVATETYGPLQRRKNFLLDTIGLEDVIPIRSTIESELLALKARHQRQEAEAAYREKLTEVKKIYERMRCGTLGAANTGPSGSSDPFALPPLSVFFTLPSVRALKGSPNPSAIPPGSAPVTRDIHSSLAVSLITADVHTWLIPVQKHLMTLLGYPNGWQSASRWTVHPLNRVTARFFCRQCGKGNVGRGYQRERCLDFKGVCSHVCKNIDGRRQEAPQEGEFEASTGDGKGKGRGKKSGGKTSGWTVDVFEKDEKAISLIKTILDLAGRSEENSTIGTVMKALGGTIRCMTCKGWIVMDFDTAIGHAHRHESMQVQLLPAFLVTNAVFHKEDASVRIENPYRSIPGTRLAFERGNTELLLGPSLGAKSLCKKINYGCKHCLAFLGCSDTLIGVEKPGNKGSKVMSFHGLRSHVKEKHGIQDIGDEDMFCYSSIRNKG